MDVVTSPARAAARQAWLASLGRADQPLVALAGDASFRRYFRLPDALVMDAPPSHEPLTAVFVLVADRLVSLGLSAPRVLSADLAQGFLLLEDLGDRTFTRALAEGADETDLYRAAIDVLIRLHRADPAPLVAGLEPFEDHYLDEFRLFTDWYLTAATGRAGDAEALWQAWRRAAAVLDMLPRHLVLRDYHVDNLMVLARPGDAGVGLLDFQDALDGPAVYDLVSLVDDARRDVPPALADAGLEQYRHAFDLPADSFHAAIAVMSVQRLLKIIGIFARLAHRDGKPGYLVHLPRLWRLMDHRLTHPALGEVATMIANAVPHDQRLLRP
ncbi:MAG: aminoglycoside phosphotransferase [Alphaproteobacteria bacterium]|nr:MAG: aminoglycoside phosphotransferase [Alphaproteobacteria bacterium]